MCIRSEIRQLRKDSKLSLETLMAISGVHSNTILRLESGKYDTRLSVIQAVANTLGYELKLEKVKNCKVASK